MQVALILQAHFSYGLIAAWQLLCACFFEGEFGVGPNRKNRKAGTGGGDLVWRVVDVNGDFMETNQPTNIDRCATNIYL